MLKDLFSNRLFIGALAFFVLMVVGGTLYLQHVEKQTAEDLAAHEERIKELTSEQKPTTETPVDDTSQGGHVHADGTWHTEPDVEQQEQPVRDESEIDKALEQSITNPTDSPELKRAKIEAYKKYYKERMGVDLPPVGYHHVRDQNGIHLVKDGEVHFPVRTQIQFRPTLEQARHIKDLLIQRSRAWGSGNREEYDRITAEIKAMKTNPANQGEVPHIGGSIYVGPLGPRELDVLREKKNREVLEEYGLEYLYDLGILGAIGPESQTPKVRQAPFPKPR
jgi:hypothetical protein